MSCNTAMLTELRVLLLLRRQQGRREMRVKVRWSSEQLPSGKEGWMPSDIWVKGCTVNWRWRGSRGILLHHIRTGLIRPCVLHWSVITADAISEVCLIHCPLCLEGLNESSWIKLPTLLLWIVILCKLCRYLLHNLIFSSHALSTCF